MLEGTEDGGALMKDVATGALLGWPTLSTWAKDPWFYWRCTCMSYCYLPLRFICDRGDGKGEVYCSGCESSVTVDLARCRELVAQARAEGRVT